MRRDFTKISWILALCIASTEYAECRKIEISVNNGELNSKIDGEKVSSVAGVSLDKSRKRLTIKGLRDDSDITINAAGYGVFFKGNNSVNDLTATCGLFDNRSCLTVPHYNITAPKVINRWLWNAGSNKHYRSRMERPVYHGVDQNGFTNLGEFCSDIVNATNMQITDKGETFDVKTVNHGGKNKIVWGKNEENYFGINFNKTKRLIVTKGNKPDSENDEDDFFTVMDGDEPDFESNLPPVVYIDDNSYGLQEILQVMYSDAEEKEQQIIDLLAAHRSLISHDIGGETFQEYAERKGFEKLQKYLLIPDMARKIWRQMIQMLMYRPDLSEMNEMKQSFTATTAADQTYSINDDEPFLRSLSKYQLRVLHQAGIIDDEKVKALGKGNILKKPSIRSMSEEGAAALLNVIENDDVNALHPFTVGWGEHVKAPVIVTSFNECDSVTMTLPQYCIMCNAMRCFRLLLLNRNDFFERKNGFTATMRSPKRSHNHAYDEWDCTAVAFYFDRIDMATDLELWGSIERGSRPSHLEAAILSYRNDYADWIIDKMRSDNNPQLQDALNRGLFAAAKNNNIEGAKLLLSNGANVSARNNKMETPLHVAVENNSKEVVEFLLSKSADVNDWFNNEQWRPLHYAAKNNSKEIAEILIKGGADIGNGSYHETLLPVAAKYNSRDVLELLLDKCQFKPNLDSLLHTAVLHDSKEVAELLISRGANIWVRFSAPEAGPLLHTAVEHNSRKVAELLISRGMDVDVQGTEWRTPLHVAVERRNKEMIQFLISKGADVYAETHASLGKAGKTPLRIAINEWEIKDAEDMVAFLVAQGVDINAKDSQGNTQLHYVENEEKLDILLKNGADIDGKNSAGQTPLNYVLAKVKPGYGKDEIESQNFADKMVPILIRKGADVKTRDQYGNTPLHYIMRYLPHYSATKLVEDLLKKGADINATNDEKKTLLHEAVSSAEGAEEKLAFLLEKKVSVDAQDENGMTPLHCALNADDNKRDELAITLINHGADVTIKDKDDGTALHYAARYNKKDVVEVLIGYKARGRIPEIVKAIVDAKDKDGWTPLYHAASYKKRKRDRDSYYYGSSVDVVQELLCADAEVDALNKDGFAPIHYAVFGDDSEAVEELMGWGANINIQGGKDNRTPLMCAAQISDSLMVSIINRGADVKLKDKDGWTALHYAARYNRPEAIEALIKKLEDVNGLTSWLYRDNSPEKISARTAQRADVDARDNDEWTPLHYAVFYNCSEAVKKLLSAKADIDAKTKDGRTAMQIAEEKDCTQVLQILQEEIREREQRDFAQRYVEAWKFVHDPKNWDD